MSEVDPTLSRRRFLGLVAAGAAVPALQACDRSVVSVVPASFPPARAVISTMRRVNDAWVAGHPTPGDAGWAWSTYMSGNVALHRVTGEVRYRAYAEQWAEALGYQLGGTAPTRDADDQCAGQVFNDLYDLDPDPRKVASIDAALAAMVHGSTTARDDWWWVDALHMAMPSFVRAAHRLDDPAYLTVLHELYRDARDRRGLWRRRSHLWYRDAEAMGETSSSGRPVLWSRGNGWAIAAHAKTLALLGPDAPQWPIYGATLAAMSETLRTRQRSDGFWNMSLADGTDVPGRETSGTALFTFGMAYGARSGLLDRARFEPVITRAWDGMATLAVQPDGRLGYVQGPARGPDTVAPTARSTRSFEVGAFLLAGCELVHLITGPR